jgi:hypothetical protein
MVWTAQRAQVFHAMVGRVADVVDVGGPAGAAKTLVQPGALVPVSF